MKKALNITLSALLCIAICVLTTTVSIGLPIYFRPFYYMQIEELRLPEITGYDVDTIKAAFDELLDFLTLPGREFGTGVFAYSEDGAEHFRDCKALFDLNITALIISLIVIVVIIILRKKKAVELCRAGGFGLPFVSGVSTLGFFAFLGAIVAIDFDAAFWIFHLIFFPETYNWIFDPRTDEIIRALPEEFFVRSAILICASIIIISLLLILSGVLKRKKEMKNNA